MLPITTTVTTPPNSTSTSQTSDSWSHQGARPRTIQSSEYSRPSTVERSQRRRFSTAITERRPASILEEPRGELTMTTGYQSYHHPTSGRPDAANTEGNVIRWLSSNNSLVTSPTSDTTSCSKNAYIAKNQLKKMGIAEEIITRSFAQLNFVGYEKPETIMGYFFSWQDSQNGNLSSRAISGTSSQTRLQSPLIPTGKVSEIGATGSPESHKSQAFLFLRSGLMLRGAASQDLVDRFIDENPNLVNEPIDGAFQRYAQWLRGNNASYSVETITDNNHTEPAREETGATAQTSYQQLSGSPTDLSIVPTLQDLEMELTECDFDLLYRKYLPEISDHVIDKHFHLPLFLSRIYLRKLLIDKQATLEQIAKALLNMPEKYYQSIKKREELSIKTLPELLELARETIYATGTTNTINKNDSDITNQKKSHRKKSSTDKKKRSPESEALKEDIEKLKVMQTCKICFERPVNTTLLPCGHLVVCESCGAKLQRCPICRKVIKGTVKTFLT